MRGVQAVILLHAHLFYAVFHGHKKADAMSNDIRRGGAGDYFAASAMAAARCALSTGIVLSTITLSSRSFGSLEAFS